MLRYNFRFVSLFVFVWCHVEGEKTRHHNNDKILHTLLNPPEWKCSEHTLNEGGMLLKVISFRLTAAIQAIRRALVFSDVWLPWACRQAGKRWKVNFVGAFFSLPSCVELRHPKTQQRLTIFANYCMHKRTPSRQRIKVGRSGQRRSHQHGEKLPQCTSRDVTAPNELGATFVLFLITYTVT